MLMRAVTRRADAAFSRNSNPYHDGWYTPTGWVDAAALDGASAETALKLSAFWRALFILSNAGVASVPCITYRKRADGGRERAEQMPIYSLLHDAPNAWQTAPEYWDFTMRALVQRGNACSLIVPGRRGVVDQLIPMHPDRLEFVEKDGLLGYRYKPDATSLPVVYTEDEVFHVRVFAEGGKVGKSLLTYMAEDTAHARALSGYGRRLFSQSPMLAGVLSAPVKLTDESARRMAQSFQQAHSGPAGWHSVAVLEQGTKWEKMGMTNEDAQFLASREFMIRDLARWTGVKKYLLESEDTPNYNSIEAFQEEHVTYALRPWAVIIEQAIKRDLIVVPGVYFAEFLLDALMRGTPITRAQALAIQRQNGVISANEWRRVENMNRREDAAGDAYWDQPNKANAAADERRTKSAREDNDDDARETQRSARALAIARNAAAVVVKKETGTLARLAQKHAASPRDFAVAVADFYQAHAAFVSEALGLSPLEAQRYCTGQRGRVAHDGVAWLEAWAEGAPDDLARLALMVEGS